MRTLAIATKHFGKDSLGKGNLTKHLVLQSIRFR